MFDEGVLTNAAFATECVYVAFTGISSGTWLESSFSLKSVSTLTAFLWLFSYMGLLVFNQILHWNLLLQFERLWLSLPCGFSWASKALSSKQNSPRSWANVIFACRGSVLPCGMKEDLLRIFSQGYLGRLSFWLHRWSIWNMDGCTASLAPL